MSVDAARKCSDVGRPESGVAAGSNGHDAATEGDPDPAEEPPPVTAAIAARAAIVAVLAGDETAISATSETFTGTRTSVMTVLALVRRVSAALAAPAARAVHAVHAARFLVTGQAIYIHIPAIANVA